MEEKDKIITLLPGNNFEKYYRKIVLKNKK